MVRARARIESNKRRETLRWKPWRHESKTGSQVSSVWKFENLSVFVQLKSKWSPDLCSTKENGTSFIYEAHDDAMR